MGKKIKFLLILFVSAGLLVSTAYAAELFHGTSSIERIPTTIIPGESQIIEIKFQYHEGPYSLNIKPTFDVSPKEASPSVEIEFEEVEGIPRMSVKRMLGTIIVDQNIPSEKIFLNISYNGTYTVVPPQPFQSAWSDTAIIDIEKNLVPEPEQDVPVPQKCGSGTTLQDGICVVDETEETQSYEPEEVLCSHPRGVQVDENCNIIRPSPYAQQKDGTGPEDVKCNHDMYRSYKTSDGSAFCASGYTLRELIHRGYAEPFDSISSATVSGSENVINEYCPASQDLLQWGWYGYVRNPEITNTNIDLVFSAEDDSHGVEFTFESQTKGKSMIWIFVECDDSFDTFEVIILPETIEHRKNFVVYYPDEQNTTIHFVNQDSIQYLIEGIPNTGRGNGDFRIWLDPQDDWNMEFPANVGSISLSASNPDTEELYEWMNYIIYPSKNGN